MRERISKRNERREVLASIQRLERQLKASEDTELVDQAEAIQKSDDSKIISEYVGGGQNERAMNNWPIEKRAKVAARLLRLADFITR